MWDRIKQVSWNFQNFGRVGGISAGCGGRGRGIIATPKQGIVLKTLNKMNLNLKKDNIS